MGLTRSWGVRIALGLLAWLVGAGSQAEVCQSPYIKKLEGPEKYLYVLCVDADAKDNDFVAVIDVNPDSPSYGTLLSTVDLGSKGNETHHWGYTDDRTRIWAGGLFSSRIWILDVVADPAHPRIEKVLEDIPEQTGLSGPHTFYALPGRMLVSFLGAADGGLPTGLAEFTNDGRFIRRLDLPEESPYGYDAAVKPELDRMVTSGFTPPRNYAKPLAQMNLQDFGSELIVWDFKERRVRQRAKVGASPLEVRWSRREGADHGFTNCALDNAIWLFKGQADGTYSFRKVAETGALPADLRQSPDDRFLFVSCFGGNEIQQWDVTDPENPTLFDTAHPGVQPNMMHVTDDGKRMYVTNSLLSTLDHAGRFWVRLIHLGPKGMKVDPFFNIELNDLPTGPARGHDMLLN